MCATGPSVGSPRSGERRGRLHHGFTRPASVLRPARDQHPYLRRRDVQPLRHVLADLVQDAPAARTRRSTSTITSIFGRVADDEQASLRAANVQRQPAPAFVAADHHHAVRRQGADLAVVHQLQAALDSLDPRR